MHRLAGVILHKAVTNAGPIYVVQDRTGRSLYFGDGPVQGRILNANPVRPALGYVQGMTAFLLFREQVDSVLQVGLGAGALTRFLLSALPTTLIDVVEAEPAVVDIARRYFDLPDDPRLRMHIGDGALHVADAGAPACDVLLVDAYDAVAMSPSVSEYAFFAACRERLTSEGIFAINLWNGQADAFAQILSRIDEVFDYQTLCLPVAGKGNVVVFAFNRAPRPLSVKLLRERAAVLERHHDIPYMRFLRQLQSANRPSEGRLSLSR
ncbi:MAG TPA: fused MFS/spermidine synthase [Gammaproteobacteria bacterium]|nr:fused MFS/spermidine synthase [Gammaproteobacteria bacterium]